VASHPIASSGFLADGKRKADGDQATQAHLHDVATGSMTGAAKIHGI